MNEINRPAIVLLTRNARHHRAFARALAGFCDLRGIVFERAEGAKRNLFQRRLKKLGVRAVADQMLFKALDGAIFQRRAAARFGEILGAWEAGAASERFDSIASAIEAETVNDPGIEEWIRRASPQVVIVSGTGLLSAKLIQAIAPVPILNIHCGITPRYRGTHGGFWAVAGGDFANAGVTIHFIDPGIDTGGIVAQAPIKLEPGDDPRTLVLKQYRAGIELLRTAIPRVAAGDRAAITRPDLDSRLYSSPTFSAWLAYRRQLRRFCTATES